MGRKPNTGIVSKQDFFFSLGRLEAEPFNYSPEPFSTYAPQLKVTSP